MKMSEVYKMIPVTSKVKDVIDREKLKRTIESGKKSLTYSELLLEAFCGKNEAPQVADFNGKRYYKVAGRVTNDSLKDL